MGIGKNPKKTRGAKICLKLNLWLIYSPCGCREWLIKRWLPKLFDSKQNREAARVQDHPHREPCVLASWLLIVSLMSKWQKRMSVFLPESSHPSFSTDKKPTNIKHSCPSQPLHFFIKAQNLKQPQNSSQSDQPNSSSITKTWSNNKSKMTPRPRHSVFGASEATTSTSGSTTDGRLEDWRLLKSTFLGRFFKHSARWASTKSSCRDRGSSRKARVFMGFNGFCLWQQVVSELMFLGGEMLQAYCMLNLKYLIPGSIACDTVDGRNPAPPGTDKTL